MSLPVSAVAQTQQTIEGAHQFLHQVFAAGGVKARYDGGSGFNAVVISWYACSRQQITPPTVYMPAQYNDVCGNTQYSTWEAPAYVSLDYASAQRCAATITGAAPSYQLSYQEGNRRYTRNSLSPLNRTIPWDKVSEVKQASDSVIVKVGSGRWMFTFPAEALSARVAFAMEFLRTHCDPTAGTGF